MSLYPLMKDEAGHHAWSVMHHRAALYSDNPTDKEKQMMKSFLYENMRSVALLCDDCKKDIKSYLKSHPVEPALKGKTELSQYLCDFHNHVNSKQNKEIKDCSKILRDKVEECKDCKVEIKKEDTPLQLRETFEKFKDISIKVFHSLCDKYGIPYPTIKFHECPSNPLTSCTSMWIDTRTSEIAERPIVYLHPNIFGLRTIVHEFLHYVKQLSKDTIGSIDEEGIERETQALLNKEFPFDEREKAELSRPPVETQQIVVRQDHYVSALRNFPISSKIYDKHLYNVKRRDFRHHQQEPAGDWIFDMLGGVTDPRDEGIEMMEGEGMTPAQNIYGSRNDGDRYQNALSFLDGLYSPFGALFGMKPSDLNRNNTPLIVSNAMLAMLKTHLSPIGALLASTVASMGIFGALALSRNGLSYGDKLLMNSFGSNFFWSAIDYVRPENKQEVIDEALLLGSAVSSSQWSLVPKILMGETLSAMVGETAPSVASPASASRNLQRAAAGIGGGSNSSRGLSSSGSNTPMRPATRNFRTGAAAGGNRARVVVPVGNNAVPMFPEGSVMIPSEEEEPEIYESSFGMHVSDGRRGEIYSDYQDDRRNTIKDVFETDPNYDNFNDVYYATSEEEEVYG